MFSSKSKWAIASTSLSKRWNASLEAFTLSSDGQFHTLMNLTEKKLARSSSLGIRISTRCSWTQLKTVTSSWQHPVGISGQNAPNPIDIHQLTPEFWANMWNMRSEMRYAKRDTRTSRPDERSHQIWARSAGKRLRDKHKSTSGMFGFQDFLTTI